MIILDTYNLFDLYLFDKTEIQTYFDYSNLQ